jgi:hypothetical protein
LKNRIKDSWRKRKREKLSNRRKRPNKEKSSRQKRLNRDNDWRSRQKRRESSNRNERKTTLEYLFSIFSSQRPKTVLLPSKTP